MIKYFILSYLNRFIDYAYSRNASKNRTNIKEQLQRMALISTSNYVANNMKNISSVDSKYKVLNIAAKNTKIDGLIMEFGVYKADTLNFISKLFEQKQVYGFDSFQGLPEFWRDGFDSRSFTITTLPKVNNNVSLIEGWFDKTIPQFLKSIGEGEIMFLHIDCDLYSSTKTIFNLLKGRIVVGTVIVFDEYFNYDGWEKGEYLAFQEYVKENQIKYEYLTYNHLHEQVAVIILKV